MLKRIDDYPAHLESAWQQHLAPRCENAPTVISTFAGCGGSSLGYSMAGYRELLAVEWNDNAVETFKLNFPDVPVYHGDISKLSVEECLQLANIKEGELDVFDGSPPCQGFSTAGKRKFSDERNQLFREYVRLLRGLRPKVFIMENVSGMVKGLMKLIFADIMRELKASGYKVSARLLNAMYFGVPQSRERMIFVGVREDLGIEASHPQADNKPIALKNCLPSLQAIVFDSGGQWSPATVENDGVMKTLTRGNHRHFKAIPVLSGKYGELYDQVPIPYGRRLSSSAAHVIKQGFTSVVKPNPDMPSCTLPKMNLGEGYATIVHPYEARSLTIEEAKLIGSYPNGFNFVGGFSTQWERIGNSVPPLFMRAIAEHVKTRILAKCVDALPLDIK